MGRYEDELLFLVKYQILVIKCLTYNNKKLVVEVADYTTIYVYSFYWSVERV
jgi:hypothetical protein